MPRELCFWNIPHQNHPGNLKMQIRALTLNLHLGWDCLVAFLCLCHVLQEPIFHVSYRAKLMATVDRGHPHGWSHLVAFSWAAIQPHAPQCYLE